MQALSIVVAVIGLQADSAALVIGAMLIAPLMTPIIACVASIAMGWPRRMAEPAAAVLILSAGSIGLAWLS